MEKAISALDALVESAKLWNYDQPSDYLVKALKKTGWA